MLHSSYSFALAFEATTVKQILDRIGTPGSVVLDPFCGTGTALLESKICGIESIGIDANPACVLVTRAKTDWSIDLDQVSRDCIGALRLAEERYSGYERRCNSARRIDRRHGSALIRYL